MKLRKIGKTGALGSLVPAVLTFVIIAIILGIGATVLTEVRSTQTSNSVAYNASTQGLDSLDTMAGYLPTLAIIVILAVIIGVIVMYLAGRFGGGF